MNKHKKTKDTAHLRGVAVILTMLLFLTGCTKTIRRLRAPQYDSQDSCQNNE